MKKRNNLHFIQKLVVLMVITAMLAGFVVVPQAAEQPEASVPSESAELSGINKLEGVQVDYKDYLDSSVMYQLPANVRKDEEISVIITVDQLNLMDAYEGTDKTMSFAEYAVSSSDAEALRDSIASQQAQVLAALDEQGIGYTVGEMYDTLLTGYELVIQAGDYAAVCQSLTKGSSIVAGEVYNVAETQLVENTVNVYETGIFKSGESGYDGSGMVVAVLDTGLDSKHTAFSPDNFTSQKLGMTYEDVAAVLSQTKAQEQAGKLSVDDVYINEKVPYGYDYADNDPDVFSTNNNHGTHVSGIIVGKDDTITGVAPNAQLVSMKVFSDIMETARSSWILSALEDCVILGVDVINISLGTSCGFSTEGEKELTSGVYQKIRDAGISLVVAASNSFSSAYGSEKNGNLGLTSNPDTGTVGSPSTYDGALAVASIAGEESPYIKFKDTIMYFDETTDGGSEENDFVETLLGDAESKNIPFVLIPGVGRSADYTGLDVKGKIALVRRGDNTFEEKALIAEKQGAAGIIIYNNVSGEIKMNVGKAKLAACSIAQTDGELLAAAGKGTLSISKKQTSGPFISSFSSWGPTPDLGIKPEITAHGGNILSSVTGGGYDRISGTSMACPNVSGVTILLRQYVVENFPEIANDNCKVRDMVNSLMMSTADIAFGKNGQPYAVRKQGAGLANLMNSIQTKAYLSTFDKEGNPMDKAKLELGDDPQKTGVYTMTFQIHNFGDKKLSYDLGAYVMTEGVSDTKTSAGETTVTEEAYILEGAQVKIDSVDGKKHNGTKISVGGGKTVKVQVTITLTEENKTYLNESFENGMYVEGFLTLEAVSGTKIDLSVPYLAFYGDWTKAPLFDLDYFETNADELDDSIAKEDKVMADAYSTRPIGGVSDDYINYLGSYYFLQDPDDMIISASRDYVALSNQEGTVHSLRFVYAGLLRNAKKVEVSITDDTTGEVVFETVDDDVRKSYGDGGTPYPAMVEIEFDTQKYNLTNNSQYTVTLTGYLDYGTDGGIATNEKNVFQFPLTVDFQAPAVTGVEYTFEYDKTLKKNRLYANVNIYDNHYSMAAQLGYVGMGVDENDNPTPEMRAFEQYLTPIYSEKNSTTTVKIELTDYIWEIKENASNKNSFAITCYDYALNFATYEIPMPVDFADFYFDGMAAEGLTMSPNEVFNLEPLVKPATQWSELLSYTSSKPSVARVVNNKLVAVGSGNAVIKVSNPSNTLSLTFPVKVLAEGDEGYRRYDKPVADIFRLVGYHTQKAYYVVDSKDKEIGDTGDKRFFEGDFSLSMYPSETVSLNYDLDPYFPKDTKVTFETSNENIVKIDQYGTVTAVAEGFASVTVKVLMDDKSTFYSETVSVEVKDPFIYNGGILNHYYGNGGLVSVPDDLSLNQIGNFAFANFEYVLKTEEELAFDDAETSKQWYIGESTITKVILPEGIKKIGAYAFANLTGLEEIVLPSTLEEIQYGAFYGCSSLKKITFSGENNLKIINKQAFEGCDLQDTVDLSAVCVISDYAFAGNTDLKGITTSDSLLSIGEYAFAGCERLANMTITAEKVKYGPYVFNGCDSLTSFYVNASVLPEGMFNECKALQSVTIGPDVNEIGAFAFRNTEVASFEIKEGNRTYKIQTADHILSADGTQLAAVASAVAGDFTQENVGGANITSIGNGAFSHNMKVTSVNLPNVTAVGDYAFGHSKKLAAVTLGQLQSIGDYGFFETAITVLPAITAETKIGKYAFAYTPITSVTIPDGMTVAEGVFAQCAKLETIVIGNDVTLGKFAFNLDKSDTFVVKSFEQNGKKLFYYEFASALKNLTIGSNADIGENAFAYHASLTDVILGENAKIGKQAFYNCTSLANIDLSKAQSIGDYAFSGDEYYICQDESMTVAAVRTNPEYTTHSSASDTQIDESMSGNSGGGHDESTQAPDTGSPVDVNTDVGEYMTLSYATALTRADLSAAATVGEYAFAMCEKLTEVVLGEAITEIPQYAFASCIALNTINLNKIQTLGDYAFMDAEVLAAADLSAAVSVGKYAFLNCKALAALTLNPEGTDMAEGAFSYCEALTQVNNMANVKNIGDYAFAYTALSQVDLTGAENIGKWAFLKEEKAQLKVTLGTSLKKLGDNPFAMCILESFALTETVDFNGVAEEKKNYTYLITDTVQVIDGSLYWKCTNGLQLITYGGNSSDDVKVAEDTVRISAMAFAGTGVQMVTMPATVFSIGHKAFYQCDDLDIVVFGSYESPIMEEEFDPAYYESFQHIPGAGDYGEYSDFEGNKVQINGMGLLPYFMWNATDGTYFAAYYGANFKDYVGTVKDKILMIHPINGIHYDSFVLNQYFDGAISGAQAPQRHTLNTIAAIKAIPDRVTYEQRAIVEKARALYSQIGTLEQQALVGNYGDLVAAEQRIKALTPTEEAPTQEPEPETKDNSLVVLLIVVGVILLGGIGAAVFVLRDKIFTKPEEDKQENPAEDGEEQPQAEEVSEEETQSDPEE